MKKKKTIAVWFSCGAASAVAAKKTIEMYGEKALIRVINNPVAEEDADNRRFLTDVEKWLGVEIEIATNPKYKSNSCVEVWETRRFMSGVSGAPCTIELKKMARQKWEEENRPDYHVLGFTYDERDRARNFRMTERENLICPLITHKLTKKDCFSLISDAGIELPRIYKAGYPNANCIGCVKATSPTYWNHVRKMHPEVFAQRADQSRRLGARLVRVKGERLFLDELPVDATGEPMKSMQFECGIFCEEKIL
jgi:PP-loop superfamily ATP-utilizing enzyme